MTKARLGLAILGLFAVLAVGCGKKIDPRFQNAKKTFTTLLAAYGVASISQDDVVKHMQGGGKFTLHNENDFREAFSDYRSPADEGSAGFVCN